MTVDILTILAQATAEDPDMQGLFGVILLIVVVVAGKLLNSYWVKWWKKMEQEEARAKVKEARAKVNRDPKVIEKRRKSSKFIEELEKRPSLNAIIGGLQKTKRDNIYYWVKWDIDANIIEGNITRHHDVLVRWKMPVDEFNKLGKSFWARHDIEAEKLLLWHSRPNTPNPESDYVSADDVLKPRLITDTGEHPNSPNRPPR